MLGFPHRFAVFLSTEARTLQNPSHVGVCSQPAFQTDCPDTKLGEEQRNPVRFQEKAGWERSSGPPTNAGRLRESPATSRCARGFRWRLKCPRVDDFLRGPFQAGTTTFKFELVHSSGQVLENADYVQSQVTATQNARLMQMITCFSTFTGAICINPRFLVKSQAQY